MFNRKIFLPAIIISLLAVFLFGSVFLYRFSRIYSPETLEYVLKETINGEVTFNRLNFSFWDGLEVKKIEVNNAGGHRDLVITAEQLNAGVSWHNILQGKIPVDELNLTGVAVFLPGRLLRKKAEGLIYETPWLKTAPLERFYEPGFWDWDFERVEFLVTGSEGEMIDRYSLGKIDFTRRSAGRWTGYLGNLQFGKGNIAGKFYLDRDSRKVSFQDLKLNFIPPETIHHLLFDRYNFGLFPHIELISARLDKFSAGEEKITAEGAILPEISAGGEYCWLERSGRVELPGKFEFNSYNNFLSLKIDTPVFSHSSPSARFKIETTIDSPPVYRGDFTGEKISVAPLYTLLGGCIPEEYQTWVPRGQIDNFDFSFSSLSAGDFLKGHAKTGSIKLQTPRGTINFEPARFILTGKNFYLPRLEFSTAGITGDLQVYNNPLENILGQNLNFEADAAGPVEEFSNWVDFPWFFPPDWRAGGKLDVNIDYFDFPAQLWEGDLYSEFLNIFGYQLKEVRGRVRAEQDRLVVNSFSARTLAGWGGGSLIFEKSPDHFDFWSRFASIDLAELFESFGLEALLSGNADLQAVMSGSPLEFDTVTGNFRLESTDFSYEQSPLKELLREVNQIVRQQLDVDSAEKIIDDDPGFHRLEAEFKLNGGRLEIEKIELYSGELFLEITGSGTGRYFEGELYIHPLTDRPLEIAGPAGWVLIAEGFPPLQFQGPPDNPGFDFSDFEKNVRQLAD